MTNDERVCDVCGLSDGGPCIIGEWEQAWRKTRSGEDLCPKCVKAVRDAEEHRKKYARV